VAASKTNKTGDTINLVGFDWDDQQDPFRMRCQGVATAIAAVKGERTGSQNKRQTRFTGGG
jgi:hypothetical protein